MKQCAILRKFEHNRVFSPDEAWMLFRVAAIVEACGWTLLICGIAWQHFALRGGHDSLLITGRVHGMLFFSYALAAVGLYPSLGWSRRRASVALLASVPPYGSLLFEQWAFHVRQRAVFETYSRCVLFARLASAEP